MDSQIRHLKAQIDFSKLIEQKLRLKIALQEEGVVAVGKPIWSIKSM
jgi:hypothetical protein